MLAVLVALAGCQNWEYGEKETAGTVIGGVGGAVLGSQVGNGSTQVVATPRMSWAANADVLAVNRPNTPRRGLRK